MGIHLLVQSMAPTRRPGSHGMLAYNGADDGEAARRARRSPAPRGRPAWDYCVRADARGDCGAPRGRRATPAAGGWGGPKRPGRRGRADRGDPADGAGAVALLVDAGPLYAYVDADDRHHRVCLELLET